MRGGTLESRLEEMGVLRSFSRPRVSNDNTYSESLFRTVKYRPDNPGRPFASKDEACEWVAAFVDWYSLRHRQAASNSCRPTSATVEPPRTFASSESRSTRKPGEQIQHAGAETRAAGTKPRKCGSTSHQKSRNQSRLYP
ncbi:integrase core domain-containing protein [Synechococcus sp. CS-1333]|uniref:integrase core domain-containing protein n=1 Tax=Synechococcus sp. CS-1333 TaxID=2848638 RepID=UPI002880375A|nr:integrase core domain-containing protein [Synechococcus sp. CS-1333]